MKSKAAFGITFLALVVSIYFLVKEHRALQNERLLLETALTKDRLTKDALLAANSRAARLPSDSVVKMVGVPSSTDSTASVKSPHFFFGIPMAAFTSEQGHKAYVGSEVGMFRARFNAFFASANLTLSQQDALANIWSEMTNERLDLIEAARTNGVPESDPNLQSQLAQITSQNYAALANALGPDAYQQFRLAMSTIPQRADTDELASELYYTNEPLTADQANQLVAILGQTSSALVPGHSFAGFGSQASVITDEAIAAAQQFLSSQQVQALRNLQALQKNPALSPTPIPH